MKPCFACFLPCKTFKLPAAATSNPKQKPENGQRHRFVSCTIKQQHLPHSQQGATTTRARTGGAAKAVSIYRDRMSFELIKRIDVPQRQFAAWPRLCCRRCPSFVHFLGCPDIYLQHLIEVTVFIDGGDENRKDSKGKGFQSLYHKVCHPMTR